MQTVWKFTLSTVEEQTINMPQGARVLHIDTQLSAAGYKPCLWALVDDEAPIVVRVFSVRGTGYPLRDASNSEYLGTFTRADGSLVYHVFGSRT